MEKEVKKNNFEMKVVMTILIMLVVGLLTYIVCDKFIDKKNDQSGKQPVEDQKDIEENKISKYDGTVKWATNIVYDQDKNILYQIIDKKLICESNRQGVCDALGEINNNLVKVIRYIDYNDIVYLLNENGEVYVVDGSNNYKVEQILNNYEIKNMATAPKYKDYTTHVELGWSMNQDQVFFLTNEDQLLDVDGQSYEESNKDFVMGYCFMFGNSYTDGYDNACIFMNDNGSISYKVNYKDDDGDYVQIKNRHGQNMSASKVYDYISDWYKNRKLLLVDSNNDLYEFKFVDGKPIVEYINNIISNTYVGEKNLEARVYTVSFELSDGTKYEFDTQESQYLDVKTNALKKLSRINE